MRTMPILLAAILLVGAAGCAQKNPAAEQPAATAAKEWLQIVDNGEYEKSWDEAASLFRNSITKEYWVKAVNGVRPPLGKNISRELKSSRYMTQMPGAPDGEYVVIQFRSSFENKKSAIETVTPMKDTNGIWRVSGYFIK